MREGARCSTGSNCTARRGAQCPNYMGSVADVLRVCAEYDGEGFVAKPVDSPYRPGERSSDWLKLKTADWRTAHASQRHRREARSRLRALCLLVENQHNCELRAAEKDRPTSERRR